MEKLSSAMASSLAQVQQITNLAKRQQIYYEVFPFEGNRVSLKKMKHGCEI